MRMARAMKRVVAQLPPHPPLRQPEDAIMIPGPQPHGERGIPLLGPMISAAILLQYKRPCLWAHWRRFGDEAVGNRGSQ
ncbi:hypothetical protein AB1N83_007518 [Pleurotus pulmonarius]